MRNPWLLCLLVGIGGFVGSVGRYGLGLASQRWMGDWPAGTLAANVLGCFVIGLVAGLSGRQGGLAPELRLALGTGFCGGFTTLSAMVAETAEMARGNACLPALCYAGGTFLLSMAAFFVGVALVRAK